MLKDVCFTLKQKDEYIYLASYFTDHNYIYIRTSDMIGSPISSYLYTVGKDCIVDCGHFSTSTLDINAELPEIPESCRCYLIRCLSKMPELRKKHYAIDLLRQLISLIDFPSYVELCDMYAVLASCVQSVSTEKDLEGIVKRNRWGTVPFAKYLMETSYEDLVSSCKCFYLMPSYAERLVKYNENLGRRTYEKYINKGKDYDKSIKLAYEDDIKRCRILIETETDDFFSSEKFKSYFRQWLDDFECNLNYICGISATPSSSVCEACLLMRFG